MIIYIDILIFGTIFIEKDREMYIFLPPPLKFATFSFSILLQNLVNIIPLFYSFPLLKCIMLKTAKGFHLATFRLDS